MIRTYYTLKDFISFYDNLGWRSELDAGIKLKVNNAPYLGYLFDIVFNNIIPSTDPAKQEISNNLFCVNLAPLYKETYIGYGDGDHIEEEVYQDFARKFLYILNTSYDKYSKLIGIYEAEKNNLMNEVSSVSESKFNDTPQNIQGTYDWSTDDHLTNVTRNVTKSDLTTKIARIDEIDRLLKDYYDLWAAEFRRLFIWM